MYSVRRLMGPPQDQPFLVLISGWSYYTAGLFSQKTECSANSGAINRCPIKRRPLY